MVTTHSISKNGCIWQRAKGSQSIKPWMAKIYRLVEAQEKVATITLVNNVYEQAVLEELLDTTKPPLPDGVEPLHYLLKTPFRYPPLKHGSRFGSAYEPSLFYGSLNVSTALAETAYYRFVYMDGMTIPFTTTQMIEYSSFSVSVRSKNSIFLDQRPFLEFESILTSPISYKDTQQLGKAMRKAGVELFQYISARDPNRGKNVGLFTPRVFHSKKPLSIQSWICQAQTEQVGFLSKDADTRLSYDKQIFCVEGVLPCPAI